MTHKIDILKGLHPGVLIERDMALRGITRKDLALKAEISLSRISEIISGKRSMTLPQSLAIESVLEYSEGFLMTLQLHYEIKLLHQKMPQKTPDLTKLSPALFWDTKIERIDWQRYKRAIIERVLAYGTPTERAEIIRFYGDDEVAKHQSPSNQYRLPSHNALKSKNNGSGI